MTMSNPFPLDNEPPHEVVRRSLESARTEDAKDLRVRTAILEALIDSLARRLGAVEAAVYDLVRRRSSGSLKAALANNRRTIQVLVTVLTLLGLLIHYVIDR